MGTIIAHEFNKGDNVTVTDKHTCLSVPIAWPCYVVDIDGDVYVMRRRAFNTPTFRVGKYYPHMKKD